MAVIPPDAGVRLRMQVDNQLQALAPVRGVPADLPELQTGQTFTARIQELLPDNTYRALVAGKQLTLQLPEGANAGDTLELTVVDRSGRTVIAQRADAQPTTTVSSDSRAYPYSRISDAGHMIGQLLPEEGKPPSPAPLSRGEPVVPQPPVKGADLAPALQKAVSQSGLFYEAHQAQWLNGNRSISSLRVEPQGQLPAAPRPTLSQIPADQAVSVEPDHLTEQGPANLTYRNPALAGDAREPWLTTVPKTDPHGKAESVSSASIERREQLASMTSSTASSTQTAANVPQEIRPLVQQQLDAVATQRLAWHGEVWPGQTVDWAIQRDVVDERDATPEPTEGVAQWSTSLRLTMPRLGDLQATLQLTGDRLRVRLTAAESGAAADLRQQAPALMRRLADAGLSTQVFEVRQEEEV